MDHSQGSWIERVLEFHPTHSTITTWHVRRKLGHQLLFLCKLRNLLGNRFETTQGCCITINCHIDLEPFVLDTEKHLLVLIASHVTKCVALLTSLRERHPNVVKDLALFLASIAAWRSSIVAWQRTVRRRALPTTEKVNLREWYGIPRILHRRCVTAWRPSCGQNALELFEQFRIPLAQERFNEAQHLGLRKHLFRIHTEALEELGPSLPAVAAEGR
mmetsp:Transcript_20891/g.30977  ORF Transcript_20891/g.30977 Transcript_20891/m.30977 type:complete len:217 (-) Transcript_20891:191-841(-)